MEEVPAIGREAVAKALGQKDGALLERLLGELRVPAKTRRALLALPEFYGAPSEVLRRARRRFGAPVKAPLDRLAAILDAFDLGALGDEATLGLDLGEVRGHAYYSGVSFQLLASGPGEPIGGGGRYDELIGRFGAAQPATGFGLSLHRLYRAMVEAGITPAGSAPLRLVASMRSPMLDALRDAGAQVALKPSTGRGAAQSALAFAQAWNYDAVLSAAGRLRRLDGATRSLPEEIDAAALQSLCAWARE